MFSTFPSGYIRLKSTKQMEWSGASSSRRLRIIALCSSISNSRVLIVSKINGNICLGTPEKGLNRSLGLWEQFILAYCEEYFEIPCSWDFLCIFPLGNWFQWGPFHLVLDEKQGNIKQNPILSRQKQQGTGKCTPKVSCQIHGDNFSKEGLLGSLVHGLKLAD